MNFKKYIIAALGALALVSCTDKMDYREDTGFDKDYIKGDFNRTAGLVSQIYSYLDSDFGNYDGALLASATDESVYTRPGNAVQGFYNGSWGSTNTLDGGRWSKCWEAISYANLFLDEFNEEQFEKNKTDLDYKVKMFHYHNFQFEVRALRAYFYFELVRMYGGVPLVTSNMSPDEVCKLERNSTDDIFKFIEDECVAIKDTIVEDYNRLVDEYGGSMVLDGKVESGRVNNLFVLALRARAAVYHASPLFNPTNDRELWKQAVQTNQDLISACTLRTMILQPDYAALFGPDNWTNAVECIFVRRNISASNSFERYNFPLGMENAVGANCPTQNLVGAYECTDGLTIEGSPLYDPNDPYSNRDSRLAKTVAVNGESWPNSNPNALQTYECGMHQADGVPYGTTTGYYLKKYVNNATVIGGPLENAFQHHWVIFRLAEFYLNYAEAIMNYTADGYEKANFKWTAAEALNVVRKRAGQPDIQQGLSLEQFTKKYENERFVELAFEGHRFYDVRRWKKGAEYFTTIRKMTITKNADGSFTFTPETLETRQWDEKMNFFPIAQSEILKSKLTQNLGW